MPTGMAMSRPGGGFQNTDDAADYFTQQRRINPAFQAPAGYEWKGDHYERDTNGAWQDIAKWTAILGGIGAMGYGGAAMAGLAPVAGSAGAAGAGGAAGASIPVTTGLAGATVPGSVGLGSLGVGGGAAGAGAAGAAGAGGTLSTIRSLAPLIGAGTTLAGSFGRGGTQQMPLQDELSGLLNIQRDRMNQAAPLYQAILRMAMGLLPMSARAGLTGVQSPTGGGGRG